VSVERGGDQALFVTASGYEQLAAELERLCTDRRVEMSERLREAREDGHLANNPALYDLLEEQVGLERRIAILERQLAAAEIVVPAADGAASIGSFVRVRDGQAGDLAEYELVGPIEADIANGRCRSTLLSEGLSSVRAQERSSTWRHRVGSWGSRSSVFGRPSPGRRQGRPREDTPT
jgi:transcription elongation factor GreA